MNRRQLLLSVGAASAAALLPSAEVSAQSGSNTKFRFCLNTSTISGQNPGLRKNIELAARAGYDGVELWVRDVQEFLKQGNNISSLKNHLIDSKLIVENAIGFAAWLVDDDEKRKEGFDQMKQEMELMAQLGCKRIAASPAGLKPEKPLDLLKAGERYKQMIELGRQTGVMPQLEFWGASGTLYHIGQAMMIAAVAGDPDVRILADIYHMFRGQSDYSSLKMLRGNILEIFHMNDYAANIPREQQVDKDRVYPGDGGAPIKQILTDLNTMGGTKVLSLELFNQIYWKQDAFHVAKTGLDKMKTLISSTN